MPSTRPKTCKVCGRHESEVGPISWRGNCEEHGRARMEDNLDELVAHGGPHFSHWRRRTLAAFGVLDLDDDRDVA